MNYNTKIYALDPGFFFVSKYLNNTTDFPQLGERIFPDYGERKKEKNFFFNAPSTISFQNREFGVQSKAIFC